MYYSIDYEIVMVFFNRFLEFLVRYFKYGIVNDFMYD